MFNRFYFSLSVYIMFSFTSHKIRVENPLFSFLDRMESIMYQKETYIISDSIPFKGRCFYALYFKLLPTECCCDQHSILSRMIKIWYFALYDKQTKNYFNLYKSFVVNVAYFPHIRDNSRMLLKPRSKSDKQALRSSDCCCSMMIVLENPAVLNQPPATPSTQVRRATFSALLKWKPRTPRRFPKFLERLPPSFAAIFFPVSFSPPAHYTFRGASLRACTIPRFPMCSSVLVPLELRPHLSAFPLRPYH